MTPLSNTFTAAGFSSMPPTSTIRVDGVFRDRRPRNGRVRTLRVDRIVDPECPDKVIISRDPWQAVGLQALCTVLRVDHADGSVTHPKQRVVRLTADRLVDAFYGQPPFESLTVDAFSIPYGWKRELLAFDGELQRMDVLLIHPPCAQQISVVFQPHLVDEPCPVAVALAEHHQRCHGFVCPWCGADVVPEAPVPGNGCELCRAAAACADCLDTARFPQDIPGLHAAHPKTPCAMA